jgi:hypothetical protein
MGVPQNRSGQRGEQKIYDPTGTQTPTPLSSNPQPVKKLKSNRSLCILTFSRLMRQREGKYGAVVRDIIFERKGQEIFSSPVSKVPRKCLLVLQLEVRLREGEVLEAKR